MAADDQKPTAATDAQPERAKPGPKPWTPTKKELTKLTKMVHQGVTLVSAAQVLGVHYDTLNERRKEMPEITEAIKAGRAKGECHVVGKLMKHINDGSVASCIFYLKARVGWKEATEQTDDGDYEDQDLTFNYGNT